jgi:hypothetical protein
MAPGFPPAEIGGMLDVVVRIAVHRNPKSLSASQWPAYQFSAITDTSPEMVGKPSRIQVGQLRGVTLTVSIGDGRRRYFFFSTRTRVYELNYDDLESLSGVTPAANDAWRSILRSIVNSFRLL